MAYVLCHQGPQSSCARALARVPTILLAPRDDADGAISTVPLLLYKSGLAGGISFSRAYAAATAAGVASEAAVAAVARLRVASRALLGRRAEEERARRRPHHCCRVAGAAHSGRYGLEHAPTSSARRRRPEELRVHRCQQREMNTMLLC